MTFSGMPPTVQSFKINAINSLDDICVCSTSSIVTIYCDNLYTNLQIGLYQLAVQFLV